MPRSLRDIIVTEYGIAFVKWDHNRDLTTAGLADGRPGYRAQVLYRWGDPVGVAGCLRLRELNISNQRDANARQARLETLKHDTVALEVAIRDTMNGPRDVPLATQRANLAQLAAYRAAGRRVAEPPVPVIAGVPRRLEPERSKRPRMWSSVPARCWKACRQP